MVKKIILILFIVLLISCEKKIKNNIEKVSIDSMDNLFCFYQINPIKDWRGMSVSDQSLKKIHELELRYEKNLSVIPPLGRNGDIYTADSCDRNILKQIFSDSEYTFKVINYKKYLEELRLATAGNWPG